MAKTKTDWRRSLGEGSLEALIRIKKEGPSLSEFNCERALDIFFSTTRFVDSDNPASETMRQRVDSD